MTLLTPMRLLRHASCAALPVVLVCATASTVHAQVGTGVGLVTAVEVGKNTLVLETRSGGQHVLVAAGATIRGDHGEVLAFGDLQPGDAVSYQPVSDTATTLHVARQFWALPGSWPSARGSSAGNR
jgi:hypothetical protein